MDNAMLEVESEPIHDVPDRDRSGPCTKPGQGRPTGQDRGRDSI